jgi:ABC-type uncharacterized transport system permease subunit
MRIELKKRENMSALFSVLSPFIALGLTLIAGVILFVVAGQGSGLRALQLLHRAADRGLVTA